MAYKFGLLFRCFSICFSYEKFYDETVKLKEIFKRNFQLEKCINRCIKNFLNKLHVPKIVELTAAREKLIVVLPYFGQQSLEIRNIIQCCLKKNTPVFNLEVVFQSMKQLSTLFTFKDKINKMLYSNLVYKFKIFSAVIFIMVKPNTISKLEPIAFRYHSLN